MAIRAYAGQATARAINRPDATPPIFFQDVDRFFTGNFTISIWVKNLAEFQNQTIIDYGGPLGSLKFTQSGNNWYIQLGAASTLVTPITLDEWVVFCIVKDTTAIRVYMGSEGPGTPAVLTQVGTTIPIPVGTFYPFERLDIKTNNLIALCNCRYWTIALNLAQLNTETQLWQAGSLNPIWASPLRVPGDMSNIANPYTGPNWADGHAYSEFIPENNFTPYLPDPAFMASSKPCDTWIQQEVPPNIEFVTFKPALTPASPTIFNSSEFFVFRDRGSVPNPAAITVVYYGFADSIGIGTGQQDSWPLVVDAGGVTRTSAHTPADRFEQDTGVAVPNATPVTMTGANLYAWIFGAQFTYVPPAGLPTKTARVGYAHLFVTYTGQPTGIPSPPFNSLIGLFAINRGGEPVDEYNNGVKLKIPDPLIRTAYIGE